MPFDTLCIPKLYWFYRPYDIISHFAFVNLPVVYNANARADSSFML